MGHIRFQWKLQLLLQLSNSLSVANCCFLPRSVQSHQSLAPFISSLVPLAPLFLSPMQAPIDSESEQSPEVQPIRTCLPNTILRMLLELPMEVTSQSPYRGHGAISPSLTPNLPYPLQLKITLSRWVRVGGGRERWGVTASLKSGCV